MPFSKDSRKPSGRGSTASTRYSFSIPDEGCDIARANSPSFVNRMRPDDHWSSRPTL